MKRIIVALSLVLILSSIAMAYPSENNLIGNKAKALETFEKENWEDAVVCLDAWIKDARGIAETFFKVVEPIGRRTETISLKNDAEKYQTEANKARIMQAKCYIELNDHQKAYESIMDVFDHLEEYDLEVWKSAVEVLSDIID